MNVISKHNKRHNPLTKEEIENGVKILIANSRYNVADIFKVYRIESKKDANCSEYQKCDCDRVCKDQCILFSNDQDETVWSCYIGTWKRV